MIVRIVSAALLATFATGLLTVDADAGERRKVRRGPAYDHFYAGPPVIRAVPGLRLLFGDYALSPEEYDSLYGEDDDRFDESYYEPEAIVPAKPQARKAAKAAPQDDVATASIDNAPAAAADEPPKAAGSLTCDKAANIVSGYGFSAVKPQTCAGKVYAFNASRDGKSFAIKLDAASGELTEVKKLQ